MTQILTVIFFTLIMALAALSQSSVQVGSAAPVFSATSMDGRAFDLNQLRGSVVVVSFWSSRCEICRNEIPTLNRMTERFDPKKVFFLGFTMEHADRVAPFLKTNPFKFHIVTDSFGIVLKYADRGADETIAMGFPAFFVIDQQGIVQLKTSGFDRTASVNAAINRLIAK